jgi:hypothetical protein
MPENIKYSTLCSTCKNAENCVTLKLSEGPIYFCEDFCVDIFPLKRDHNYRKEKLVKDSDNEKDADSGKYFGLCVNCDNRHKCSLSNSEGGVWHCEEYQ